MADLKSTLKTIKLRESSISMILGLIVVVVIGFLVINYINSRRQGATVPPATEVSEEITLPTSHTVEEGDNLSTISEKYYGTKDNWVDIRDANQINDANKIAAGQVLTIPDVEPKIAQATGSVTPTASPTATIESPTPQPTVITPTPVPQQAVDSADKKVHKVKQGENLWKISETYFESGYNWVDIASENKLSSPNKIEVDQELLIPAVEKKTVTTAQAISGATYKVEKGDTLWSIAVRAYGDGFKWNDIAKENNLNNPNVIHTGNDLRLPR